MNEAVSLYLKSQKQKTSASLESDSLVGLFASDNVATNSEDILQQEIIEKSGWIWKESNP